MNSLKSADPEIFELCQRERQRQINGIELIASENFVSDAICGALSSAFHNKYSEGAVGASLSSDDWGVNVQAYSGSPANFAVYTGLVGPHGRIMGLSLPDGGHLTHGFYAPSGKKVSATSLYFESMPYNVDKETGLIDYDGLAASAKLFRPKLIVAGTSAYSRQIDYGRFRQIANSVGAILMVDMAHISGIIASGFHPSPFEYADVVTTTTHKTMRAARGALIFYKKRRQCSPVEKDAQANVGGSSGDNYVATDYGQRINEAVFPGLQGGPHNNNIAGIAVGLHEALQPAFKEYVRSVLANSKRLASKLQEMGYTIVTGGTDTHLFLVDFRPQKIDGARVDMVLERIGISLNKNTVPGDVSAFRPSGIRIGTPAVTTRGFGLEDMDRIAAYIDAGVQIAIRLGNSVGINSIKDFKMALETDAAVQEEMQTLKSGIAAFASGFPLPGF